MTQPQSILPYRPSEKAVFYKPPRAFDTGRLFAGFSIAVVLLLVGSIAYAYLEPMMNTIVLRVLALIVACMCVAGINLIPIRYGNVRTLLLAVLITSILSIFSLIVMWMVWLHNVAAKYGAFVHYTDYLRHPTIITTMIRIFYQNGTWTYGDSTRPIHGIPLAIIWLIEAAAILSAGIFLPTKAIGNLDPVCPECNLKCKRTPKLPRFDLAGKDQLIAAVEGMEFERMLECAPPENEDDPEILLTHFQCPRCKNTNVITLHQAGYVVRQNRVTLEVKPIVQQVLIPPEEAKRLAEICEQINESPRLTTETSTN